MVHCFSGGRAAETNGYSTSDAGRIKPPHIAPCVTALFGWRAHANLNLRSQSYRANECAIIVANGSYYHNSYVLNHLRALPSG